MQSWVFKKSIFSGHYLERMVSIQRERERERRDASFRKSQSQQCVSRVVIRREAVLDQKVKCTLFRLKITLQNESVLIARGRALVASPFAIKRESYRPCYANVR